MNIFNKITDNELAMMTDYIEAHAGYDGDGGSLRAPLSHILRFWDEAKMDLFKVFGGEILLTRQICFTKPQALIEDDICCKVTCYGGDGNEFVASFNDFCRKQKFCDSWDLGILLHSNTLATNVYNGPAITLGDQKGHIININPGCKASKVLGKIATEFNLAGYEKFRIAHSQCLNQKKLNGELCVSIHPLDYMTMSDNNCGWSSCMSWEDTGDYRQGTVEMMNSPYIVVAYLKSESNPMNIGGYEWNSKKWRQLFIVTPHIITGIREYPYESPELNGIVLQWLRELAQTNAHWGPYEDTTVQVKNHHNPFPVASLGREISLNFYTNFMYNDFYSSHLAYLSPSIPDQYELCFSGVSECMECGMDISNYDHGNCALLACDNCEEVCWCYECGERVTRDDCVCINGNYVCQYCYENCYRDCDLCEETHHESDLTTVYLRVDNDVTCYHMSVCCHCIDSDSFVASFGLTRSIPYGRWDRRTIVDLDNIADIESLERFDIWNDTDYEEYSEKIQARASDEN